MSTINITMTVETQPAIGMHVSGPACPSFGMTAWTKTTATQVNYAQVQASGNGRDRHVAALVKGAFPGTSAWRPPNC